MNRFWGENCHGSTPYFVCVFVHVLSYGLTFVIVCFTNTYLNVCICPYNCLDILTLPYNHIHFIKVPQNVDFRKLPYPPPQQNQKRFP